MNKDLHMSYQYRRVNIKGGSDIVKKRPGPGYTMPLQCLSYKGLKEEEQKNKIHLGRFPYLQGHSIPQAGYTMLLIRVDIHIHCYIAVMLGETGLPILGFARGLLPLVQDGDCRHTGQLWPPQASLY